MACLLGERRALVHAFGERLIVAAGFPHGQHRTGGISHYSFGHAAEHGVHATNTSMGPHDDELVVTIARALDDLPKRIPRYRAEGDAVAEHRFRALDRLVHRTLHLVARGGS